MVVALPDTQRISSWEVVMSMTTVHQQQSTRLRSYGGWLNELGISRSTGWRWRKQELFKTHRIGGKLFVEENDINKLYQQAKAGEFAQPSTTPRLKGSG